jgi:DNA-binding XRE family transcriptional regulator
MGHIKLTGREFSRRIRAYRLQKGMSLETLAGSVGISRQALEKIEKGGGASLHTALSLAEVMGVDVRDLVGSP